MARGSRPRVGARPRRGVVAWVVAQSGLPRIWRLVDPGVPRTQAVRRLRALVLGGGATLAVAALLASAGGPPAGGPAAATTAGAAVRPPATVRALAALAPPGPAPVITRVETPDPVAFVTIDDGFTRQPDTIATLARLRMPVTAFVLDRPAQAGAAFFRALPGGAVEAHSRDHADLRTLPEEAQRAEICGNADAIARAVGRRPVLLRPPYGHYNAATTRAAAACGMAAVVLWEVVVDGDALRFRTVRRIRAGDIILLHFRPELPRQLEMIADRVRAAGLRVARLEDYVAAPLRPAAG